MSENKGRILFFKVYQRHTIIILCFIIHCFFSGCGDGSTDDGEKTEIETEKELPEITMTISAAGVPVLHRAICIETPELKIFKDGLVVKRYQIPESEFFVWRKDNLDPGQHEQLYDEIVQLGFWEWDVEQINSEINNIQEYYDIPMYTLTVELEDRQKKFYAIGIDIYYEDWNITSLENPCKVFDILSAIETTDELYVPSKIECIVLTGDYGGYEYLDDDENLSTVPWPYDDYPLDGLEYDWKRGSRFNVEGDLVASMVELMNNNMYFSYKERVFLVRYRPIF